MGGNAAAGIHAKGPCVYQGTDRRPAASAGGLMAYNLINIYVYIHTFEILAANR